MVRLCGVGFTVSHISQFIASKGFSNVQAGQAHTNGSGAGAATGSFECGEPGVALPLPLLAFLTAMPFFSLSMAA